MSTPGGRRKSLLCVAGWTFSQILCFDAVNIEKSGGKLTEVCSISTPLNNVRVLPCALDEDPDDVVVAVSGYSGDGQVTPQVRLYDPFTGTFRRAMDHIFEASIYALGIYPECPWSGGSPTTCLFAVDLNETSTVSVVSTCKSLDEDLLGKIPCHIFRIRPVREDSHRASVFLGGGGIKMRYIRASTAAADAPKEGYVSRRDLKPSGGCVVTEYLGHEREVWGLDYSFDDKLLFTSSRDKTMRIWPLYTPKESAVITLPQECLGVHYSKSQRMVLCGLYDGEIRAYDPRKPQKPVFCIRPHTHGVLPGGGASGIADIVGVGDRRFASVYGNKTLALWSHRGGGMKVHGLSKTPGYCNSVCYVPYPWEDDLVSGSSAVDEAERIGFLLGHVLEDGDVGVVMVSCVGGGGKLRFPKLFWE